MNRTRSACVSHDTSREHGPEVASATTGVVPQNHVPGVAVFQIIRANNNHGLFQPDCQKPKFGPRRPAGVRAGGLAQRALHCSGTEQEGRLPRTPRTPTKRR